MAVQHLAGIRLLVAPNALKEAHTRKGIILSCGIVAALVILASAALLLVRSIAPELTPVACSQAMPAQQAQKLWNDNQGSVRAIRAIHDSAGQITVDLNAIKCPGRAFLDITFDTADGRHKVQQLLTESPLKALPVTWHNA